MEIIRVIYSTFFGEYVDYKIETCPPKIVALGNVLIDLTVKIDDPEVLERHGIDLESKGEIDATTLTQITDEVRSRSRATINPGGSALNTVRILKRLGTDALFFGAVGNDENADRLRDILRDNGIRFSFQIVPDHPTGQCTCFVLGDKTALYADIGASAKFTAQHLCDTQTNLKFLSEAQQTQIFYLEGFFIPQRLDVCKFIVESYIGGGCLLALNLSAPYIVRENFKALQELLNHSTLVFGNRSEFNELKEQIGSKTIADLAKELLSDSSHGTLVVTNGAKDVQVFSISPSNEVTSKQFTVPKVENVVDTTGAGDSFVAGFLHSYLIGSSLDECILAAIDAASKVVTQVGCNLP